MLLHATEVRLRTSLFCGLGGLGWCFLCCFLCCFFCSSPGLLDRFVDLLLCFLENSLTAALGLLGAAPDVRSDSLSLGPGFRQCVLCLPTELGALLSDLLSRLFP